MSYKGKFMARIVRPGKALNTSDPNDIVFDAERQVAKANLTLDPLHVDAKKILQTTELPAGRHNLLKFEHKYPYTPGIIALVSLNGTDFFKAPLAFGFDFETGSDERIEMYADNKFFYVDNRRNGTWWNPSLNRTIYIKYTILNVIGME